MARPVGPLVLRKVYDHPRFIAALQLMLNRMAVSETKYGPLEDNYPVKSTGFANAMLRLEQYQRTGNTENLIDAANFLLIESLYPSKTDAHFRATDSDESPGLVTRGTNEEIPSGPRGGSNPNLDGNDDSGRDASYRERFGGSY